MANPLNPTIRNIEYGKKEIKSIQIFPLSIRDQFKLSSLITDVVTKLVAEQQENEFSDAVFVQKAVEAIEENIAEILVVAADVTKAEADEVLDTMTNPQLLELVEVIWEVNYEHAIKKGKDLLERGRKLFPSRKSSVPSLSDSPSTE